MAMCQESDNVLTIQKDNYAIFQTQLDAYFAHAKTCPAVLETIRRNPSTAPSQGSLPIVVDSMGVRQ